MPNEHPDVNQIDQHEINQTANRRVEYALLAVLLMAYTVVAVLFAVQTPDWQAPDEPAHYNYVAQVAENGCCPIIEEGDWNQEYLQMLTASRFAPEALEFIDRVQYEDHQPPLYYLLMAPFYSLTNGSLSALRIVSAMFGLVIVICAYGVGRTMFPDQPQISLGAAAFVAFVPQHVAILSSVNNDALGWALAGIILWSTIAYVKYGRVPVWALGVLVGVGLVTKATVYLMAGIVFVAILSRWWLSEERRFSDLVRAMALYLVPALAIGLIWWVRNFSVYGFPDFLGLAAHDAVVVGQPRTADLIAQVGLSEYLRMAADVTFSSFWGRFGWMALPLVGSTVLNLIYPAFGVILLTGLAGLILHARRAFQQTRQLMIWLLLGLTILLSILAYFYYNTEFQQFQGRYMYPLLIPLGIVLAVGLDAWRRVIVPDVAHARWAVYGLFFLLAPLNVWLLWTIIVPNLTP